MGSFLLPLLIIGLLSLLVSASPTSDNRDGDSNEIVSSSNVEAAKVEGDIEHQLVQKREAKKPTRRRQRRRKGKKSKKCKKGRNCKRSKMSKKQEGGEKKKRGGEKKKKKKKKK